MSKQFYSVATLSTNISETPEGFLICKGVPITRAGDLIYMAGETGITPGEGHTIISRTIEDIHDPETIASFEGKPVTINHPDGFVTPDNWRALAVGTVQNVRPGEGEDADKLLADLLITDAEAIYSVKNKVLRQVSCGYEAEFIEDSPGRGRQENIIGNHVALVKAGRCGSECAIFDHAPKQEKAQMKLRDKILAALGIALDEAMPEEKPAEKTPASLEEKLAAAMARIESLEAAMKPEGDADPTPEEIAAAEEAKKAEDEKMAAEKAAADELAAKEQQGEPKSVEERIAAIEQAVAKILGIEEKEGEEVIVDECKDSDTIARAEILAPGIAKTSDVKVKALNVAYGTKDGKSVIDTLLAGKTFDSADKDSLFVSASELLKGKRRTELNSIKVSLDSLPAMKQGAMTPEMVNEQNAARYGNK